MKKILCICFLIIIIQLFSCHSPEVAKNRKGVKYIVVTADIPDNKIIQIINRYKSVPVWCGCKSLSEQSWNWVPLEYSDIYLLSKTDSAISGDYYADTVKYSSYREVVVNFKNNCSICVPLYIDKTTVCRWVYWGTEISVCEIKYNVEAGIDINPYPDTTLSLKYKPLIDTVRVFCYQQTNQLLYNSEIHTKCNKCDSSESEYSYYTFEGISSDTARVHFIVHNDTGPVRYLDTLTKKFRVFGKDEIIPGLKNQKR